MASFEAFFGTPPLHNSPSLFSNYLALRILITTSVVSSTIKHIQLLPTHKSTTLLTLSLYHPLKLSSLQLILRKQYHC